MVRGLLPATTLSCCLRMRQGLVPLEGRAGETVTRGLDTLHDSCVRYYA